MSAEEHIAAEGRYAGLTSEQVDAEQAHQISALCSWGAEFAMRDDRDQAPPEDMRRFLVSVLVMEWERLADKYMALFDLLKACSAGEAAVDEQGLAAIRKATQLLGSQRMVRTAAIYIVDPEDREAAGR